MAMAEAEGWRRDADQRLRELEERARLAEERRLDAEGRCFQAERRRLDAERRAQLLERALHEMSLAVARMRRLVGELTRLAAHLRGALDDPGVRSSQPPPAEAVEIDHPTEIDRPTEIDHRTEMADALAAAVERLRARVAAVGEPAPRPSSPPQAPVERRPPHKHTMSWIARRRARRKQRLSR
jgi:hypothetical protein